MLKYTNFYSNDTDPFWFTEFVGINGLNVASDPIDFSDVVAKAQDLFEHRDRNKGNETWQTSHTSVYDIQNKKLYVHSQEQDSEYVFTINQTDISLPVVTSDDNGKILKVVDGQWALVDLE